MKGVPRFMQQGLDILHHSGRIHEDEGPTPEMEGVAVPPGSLALSAVEIHQTLIDHQAELARQHRVEALEQPSRFGRQLRPALKRTERLVPIEADVEVPGPEPVETEPRLPNPVEALNRGHHHLLHRPVKSGTVGGGIVESALRGEGVGLVVGKSGVGRDPLAQLVLAIEEGRDPVPRFHVGAHHPVEGPGPNLPVWAGKKRGQMRQGLPVAVPIGHEATGQTLVLGRGLF